MQKLLYITLLTVSILLVGSIGALIALTSDASGQTNAATHIFEYKSLTLSPNIKHLVLLIPNEAHESINQPRDQWPLANQPYLPQKAIISPRTKIGWFNADVDHDHKITLSNERYPENVLFDEGNFAFNDVSQPIVLNDTGTYDYYEANVNDNDRDFVMRGNITVISQKDLNPSNSTSPISNADTAGVLVVPTQDIGNYIQNLKSKGFTIDSMHNFKDIRGGQEGTGDQQTLLVWTTSGIGLDEVFSVLQEITPELPYS